MTYSIITETQREGLSAEKTLSSLIASDDAPGLRQFAVSEATGTVENFTGGKCVAAAGGHSGDQVPVRGITLASPEMHESMLLACESVTDEEREDAIEAVCVLGDNLQTAFCKAVQLGRAGQADEAAGPVTEVFDAQPHGRPCLDLVAAVYLTELRKVTTLVSK